MGSVPLQLSPPLGFWAGGCAPSHRRAPPGGQAQGCAQTCGKWIVAGSCRVITLNKSLSMRSAANCHPEQPAAERGQAGGWTGCAPTADSLKMSRGNGDGSVPEQPRQDCAARDVRGEPRGCFCPHHPLVTQGFTACSPQEPAGTPVPDPPKRFFPPQTASQKAGGEPDAHPILSMEAEADLGPPPCPLPQFPNVWGQPAPAFGGAQPGDPVHPRGRGLQPSPALCPQRPGEAGPGSGPRGAHHKQVVQPCRPRQRGRGAIRLPDCQIKRLHFR